MPVSVDEVDAREARLRASRLASSLPRPGTSEGRQLRRWLTQLLVTERVVAAEASARGLSADGAPAEDDLLPDMAARLEIGSVAASVLADPLARALFASVTAGRRRHRRRGRGLPRRNPLALRRHRKPSPNTCAPPPGAARSGSGWTPGAPTLVRLAPGYEHPGDPRQPDNTHRH